MTKQLYEKYLLAEQLEAVAIQADVRVDLIQIQDHDWVSPDVHLQVAPKGSYSEQSNEGAAVALLDAMPSLSIRRNSGLIYLEGETTDGLRYRFYTGRGVCERVKVGERTVMKPDPDAPLVEVTEDVFEIMCSEPVAS